MGFLYSAFGKYQSASRPPHAALTRMGPEVNVSKPKVCVFWHLPKAGKTVRIVLVFMGNLSGSLLSSPFKLTKVL
jgi:hypothetical protein